MSFYFSITVGSETRYYVPLFAQGSAKVGWMPYIISISPYERKISSDGMAEATEMVINIRDEDMWFHNLAHTGTDFVYKLCSLVTDFYTFNGVVSKVSFDSTYHVEIKIRDILSWVLQWNYPKEALNKTDFPNLPDDNLGLPFIYPYGIMDSSNYANPHGCYDTPCVDGRGLISGTNYNDYLISCKTIESLTRVWREEAGKWIDRTSSIVSFPVGGYGSGIQIVRLIPQAFYASDVLKEATIAAQNHCHVWNVGRFRVGSRIVINADTVNIYTVTGNDSIDMLSIAPNIVNGAAQFATIEGVNEDTLKLATVVGQDHCHINYIGTFPDGAKIKLGETGTIYTVTGNDTIDKITIVPNIQSIVAIGQPVRWEGDNGAMPGLEKIRVDVRGIAYLGTVITDACAVRRNFLENRIGIGASYFDAATWNATSAQTVIRGITLAGCINNIQAAAQIDSAMGISSGTDLYINRDGKLCIRLFNQVVYPGAADIVLETERDCISWDVESERDIINYLTLKYCNAGDVQYASTLRTDLVSIADHGRGSKIMNLDFCWSKISADAVGDIILVRYKNERRILNAKTRLLYDIYSRVLDLNQVLENSDTAQVEQYAYYNIERMSIGAFDGLMEFNGFTTDF